MVRSNISKNRIQKESLGGKSEKTILSAKQFFHSMTLQVLIHKHDLSASYLARSIRMQRGTFNNKLKGNNNTAFTDAELTELRTTLDSINKDLTKFLKLN